MASSDSRWVRFRGDTAFAIGAVKPQTAPEGTVFYETANAKPYLFISGQWKTLSSVITSSAPSGLEVLVSLPIVGDAGNYSGRTVVVGSIAYIFIGGAWKNLSDYISSASGTGAAGGEDGFGGSGVESTVSDAGTFVLTETSLDMHCWGENPVVTAKLQLNGQDRFSEREGTYFDLVQPFQHHTRNPDTGINIYSFALRPEEHQPSGSCNFSRIDNATLQLVLSNATVEGTKTAKVRIYAVNYNVLRVMSGMGGLAYSN